MSILDTTPILAVRDHPSLASSLRSLHRRGRARVILPGIYAHPDVDPEQWQSRITAACLWAPGHAVMGAAAAKLRWWPELECPTIELWGTRRKDPAEWISVRRSVPHPDLISFVADTKVALPALSAVQLAAVLGGEAIDEALRRGVADVPAMHEALALIPKQPGNTIVRRLLWESRDTPWSEFERLAHQKLRSAGILGWRANATIVGGGQRFPVDLLFRGARLIVELDGWEFHRSQDVFERDRMKQNLLVLAGWRVLRYTWATIDDLVPQLRRALAS